MREVGVWRWCLHCERVYLVGAERLVRRRREVLRLCPYDGCEGDAVFDSWPWVQVLEAHPEYPESPERGKLYPLY
jgi:hypothetical protein